MKTRKIVLAVILAVACTFSGIYLPPVQAEDTVSQIPEEGLTGYWNFDDADQPMANSVAGSDLTGELSGTAVSVQQSETAGRGGVLRFGERGAQNSEMRIADAINSGNEFSISLWVNNSSAQNSSLNTIILQQSDSGRSLLFRNNDQYITYISGANKTLGASTGSDVWEHLVLVKSGNTASYNIALYVNGVKAGEQSLNAGRVDALTDLIIGAHKSASDKGQFVGDIDEIRLYNRVLTEDEITALYENPGQVTPEPEPPEPELPPCETQISDGEYVYFGEYDTDSLKWRVLDADTTNTNERGMLIITEELLGTGSTGGIYFNESSSDGNDYQNSYTKTWCTEFYGSNLTSGEQSVLLEVSKNDGAYESSKWHVKFRASDNILNKDKVFFLSAEEAEYYFPTDRERIALYNGENGGWWLRSPVVEGSTLHLSVGYVQAYGQVYNVWMIASNQTFAARPAANVDLSSILFASAAEGGKQDGGLAPFPTYDGNEWKLTVIDSARSDFRAETDANVDGEVTISYSGAETGANEYISAVVKNADGDVTYYGRLADASEDASASGSVQAVLPEGFNSETDTLYVFNEQCNGDYKTDYASPLQAVSLLSKADEPSAVFNASGDSSGTLSDVSAGMKYSLDGGETWNDITGTTMELTGVSAANDIKVYQPGDGTTTADSDIQIIDVTQAQQPAGLDGIACTTLDQNDGQISGVNTTMEYKLSTDSQWTEVESETLTGLEPGTYDIRVKASGSVLASPTVPVTVSAHVCTAAGEWQHNEDSHWKLCSSCGSRVDEGRHEGGTAGYFEQAHCTVCGQPYGEELAVDTTLPTGEITIGGDTWSGLQDTITFNRFYGQAQTIQFSAQDDSYSHAGYTDEDSVKIEYYLHSGDKALTEDELNSKEFTEYSGAFNISEDGKYIIYVRLTDHAGNVTWLSSDGIVLDSSAPVISGIEAGRTYCISAEFTVEDDYLDMVMVDGVPVTSDDGRYLLPEGVHTVKVSDMAGNETVIQVTVNKTHTFTWVVDKPATATEAGVRHEECTVCGYKGVAEVIPATGSIDEGKTPEGGTPDSSVSDSSASDRTVSPKSGDNSSLLVWICMTAAAGVILAGTAISRRSRKK